MKRVICILLILIISSSITGCSVFKNPKNSWDKANAKVVKTEQKLTANDKEIINQAKQYIFAADISLKADKNPNKNSIIAESFADRAILTLGPPTMDESSVLRTMVNNLLATNKQIVAKGERQLANLDAQLADLQNINNKLQETLNTAEAKVFRIGETNSAMANKWNMLMRVFWWTVYAIIAAFVIKILSIILPPPYNSVFGIVDYILGGLIRFIFKLAPKAMETAKVVKVDYQTALNHVVTSIEDVKAKNPLSSSPLINELKSNTDENSKKLITQTKQNLGYI